LIYLVIYFYTNTRTLGLLPLEVYDFEAYSSRQVAYFLCRYQHMSSCWAQNPEERPNFEFLEDVFDTHNPGVEITSL